MKWNWQHESWPNFSWDQSELEQLESRHLRQSGMMIGSIRHFNAEWVERGGERGQGKVAGPESRPPEWMVRKSHAG